MEYVVSYVLFLICPSNPGQDLQVRLHVLPFSLASLNAGAFEAQGKAASTACEMSLGTHQTLNPSAVSLAQASGNFECVGLGGHHLVCQPRARGEF